MVSGLLAVDLVILLTWQIQDPLERRLETFPLEDPISASDDVKIRPELEHCESVNNSVWLGEKMQFYSFFSSIIDKVLAAAFLVLWTKFSVIAKEKVSFPFNRHFP
jgi:hypothetical protein